MLGTYRQFMFTKDMKILHLRRVAVGLDGRVLGPPLDAQLEAWDNGFEIGWDTNEPRVLNGDVQRESKIIAEPLPPIPEAHANNARWWTEGYRKGCSGCYRFAAKRPKAAQVKNWW